MDRLIRLYPPYASLAQLDSASGYEPEGWEFESLKGHHMRTLSLVVRHTTFNRDYSLGSIPLGCTICPDSSAG